MAHQTKFVVKPPSRTTMSFGKPDQRGRVPAFKEVSPVGLPAARAKAKQALMMPANVATRTPLAKLNSAITFCFSAVGSSFSLVSPARAATRIPSKQTATPPRVIQPGVELMISRKLDWTGREGRIDLARGGTSVPNAAQ